MTSWLYTENQYATIGIKVNAASGVSLAVDDIVELTDDKEVNKPSTAGSTKILGRVAVATKTAGGECVVNSNAVAIKQMIAGAAVPVGPVVYGTGNKIIAYNSGVHDSAAIIGLALTAAAAEDDVIEVACRI